MKVMRILSILLITGILTACTGTTEEQAPTLLIVGYGAQDNGRIALVKDSAFTSNVLADRFDFLEDSVRPLPENSSPVAYDLIDRVNTRRKLVVLSRDSSNNSFLSFFDTAAVNTDALDSSFSEFTSERLTLADIQIDASLSQNIVLCPVQVQASQSGRYLALLSDQSVCNSTNQDISVDLIDLEAPGGATIVQHVQSILIFPTMYLRQSQSGDSDRLFYFRQEANGAELNYWPIPTRSDSSPDFEVVTTDVVIEDIVSDPVLSLSEVQDTLVALLQSRFATITNANATPSLGDVIATSSSSKRLIVDDYQETPEVVVLNETRFTVHSSVSDTSGVSEDIEATDGTIQSRQDFVYFVGDGDIILFDIKDFSEDDDSSDLDDKTASFSISQLEEPVFISWVIALLPDESP